METINPEEIPERTRTKKIVRSWFTKKLERKFEEKELDVPQRLLSILDIPFEDFTRNDKQVYENELKPIVYIFVEQLMDVYEVMGRPRSGWEEMLERVEPSPIKVLATLVIHEEDQGEAIEDDIVQTEEIPPVSRVTEKFSVRSYNDKDKQKERWWEKKIF